MSAERDFSKDLIWGTATASYQVEGAAYEDGKGPSIWTAFEKMPGGIADNVTGDVTSNQYHCYPEDIRLMKEAGMNAYRFSLAWSRIFPEGKGKGKFHDKAVLGDGGFHRMRLLAHRKIIGGGVAIRVTLENVLVCLLRFAKLLVIDACLHRVVFPRKCADVVLRPFFAAGKYGIVLHHDANVKMICVVKVVRRRAVAVGAFLLTAL